MCLKKNLFIAFIGLVFFFQHSLAGEDTHTSDVTINSDTTDQQTIGDNLVLRERYQTGPKQIGDILALRKLPNGPPTNWR